MDLRPLKSTTRLPTVSVVVPFYRHYATLPACLASLENQTYERSAYEVIVVNNSDEDEPRTAWSSSVRLCHEPQPGSYAARNRGISNARGEIVTFTDADCLPNPNWIRAGVECLLNCGEPAIVGGRVAFFYRAGSRPTMFELYDATLYFRQEFYIRKDHFGATANLFVPRSVFERVGVFNPALKSSGDLEWGQRAHAQRIKALYCSDAVVEHPARRSFTALVRKARRLAGGVADLRPKSNRGMTRVLLDFADELSTARGHWKVIRGRASCSFVKAGVLGTLLWTITLIRVYERLRLFLGGTSRRD
jgi:glycosyltransferase involved in cell wall biosynthesis